MTKAENDESRFHENMKMILSLSAGMGTIINILHFKRIRENIYQNRSRNHKIWSQIVRIDNYSRMRVEV